MPDTEVAIIGYEDTYASEDDVKAPLELAVDVVLGALDDAGITLNEVDSILTPRPPIAEPRPQWNNVLSSYLGTVTEYSTEVTIHGAGGNAVLKHALTAINSGLVDTVLCVSADAAASFTDPGEDIAAMDIDPEFERPYGPFMPSIYAMIAQRHMHEYGTTREQMAKVAVELRKWGTRHPEAEMSGEGEITINDVLSSRPICEPFNLLDCAPWGPAGTGNAFIVTAADRADEFTTDPIYVRGVGEYNTHEQVSDKLTLRGVSPNEDGPTLTTTGSTVAAEQAYQMAGLQPADMDMVQLPINFTGLGIILLEDLGFCAKGDGGTFVENGGIDFDGGLPVSTNGGWLSFGEPVISGIMDMIVEAVRQLRGEPLGAPVGNADTALTMGGGGVIACNAVSILSTERDA